MTNIHHVVYGRNRACLSHDLSRVEHDSAKFKLVLYRTTVRMQIAELVTQRSIKIDLGQDRDRARSRSGQDRDRPRSRLAKIVTEQDRVKLTEPNNEKPKYPQSCEKHSVNQGAAN